MVWAEAIALLPVPSPLVYVSYLLGLKLVAVPCVGLLVPGLVLRVDFALEEWLGLDTVFLRDLVGLGLVRFVRFFVLGFGRFPGLTLGPWFTWLRLVRLRLVRVRLTWLTRTADLAGSVGAAAADAMEGYERLRLNGTLLGLLPPF